MLKTSNKGKVELIGHEGICLSKYLDSVGVWTIGAGATKTEIPSLANWPLERTLTIHEVFKLFGNSLKKYEDELNKYITVSIHQYQFDALVSWCYNVGIGWVKSATVIKLINHKAPALQIYNALMMYRKPKEIIGRRTKEAKLLAYGTYSNKGEALLFPVSKKGYPVYGKGTTINVWEYIDNSSEDAPVVPTLSAQDEKESVPNILRRVVHYILGDK